MIAVGERISYKSKGKLARLEGKAGQVVTGVVLKLGDDDTTTVMPDHRMVDGASFHKLAAIIDNKSIIKPKKSK